MIKRALCCAVSHVLSRKTSNRFFVPNKTAFFKSYSTSFVAYNVAPVGKKDKNNLLSFSLTCSEYKTWTTIQICALLTCRKEFGANLSVQDVKPLYNSTFKGTTLEIIIRNIKSKDVYFAYDQLCANIDYKDISRTTLNNIVFWVDRILIPGLIESSNRKEKLLQVDLTYLDYFLITELLDEYVIDNMASILDDLLDSVVVKMIDPNEYERMVNEEIKKTKESLGLLANPSAEWPYVFHGDTIDLDWRFSTCVLSSKYEAHSISSVQGSDISLPNIFDIVNVPPIRTTYNREMLPSVGSAHEYVADTIKKGNLLVLLALSGAGKSHTLFNLSTSEQFYCIPIDFGSVEDKSNDLLMRHCFDLINQYATLIQFSNNDPIIDQKNRELCKTITSIIATAISVKAMMLLKLLRQSNTQSITPSQWIKYLYNGGGKKAYGTFLRLFPLVEPLNRDGAFLKNILDQLDKELQNNPNISCRKLALTIDEINPIISMAYGKIQTSDGTKQGSVGTLLIRLLESVSIYAPSVLAGTKINNSLLKEIVSTRLKEKIKVFIYYGPPTTSEMINFAKKFFSPPKYKFGSNYLLESICHLLNGRRRAFMNFMTDIVYYARLQPCPKQNGESLDEYKEIVNRWKLSLILRAFINFQSGKRYLKQDITNFLMDKSNVVLSIESVKKQLFLNLVYKNVLKIEEINNILLKQFPNEDQLELRGLLVNSIINYGIGFGIIDGQSEEFIPTEVISTILMNKQLTFEESIEFVNDWLNKSFIAKDNEELGKIFEIIGALILQRLGFILNGKPMSDHSLFSHLKGSILDNYTLPKKLSIIYNKHYWKYLPILDMLGLIRDRLISYDFRDVCVVGLEQGVKVDIKSVAIPLTISDKLLEINMASKFITNPKHDEEFKNNFNATNPLNGFKTNDLQKIQEGKEVLRENLLQLLHERQCPSIRIVFDYTATSSHYLEFDNMISNEKTYGTCNPQDVVILFGRNNANFDEFFKEHFLPLHTTINQYLHSKQASRNQ